MGGSGDDDLAPTEGLATRGPGASLPTEGALAPGARIGRYRIEALLGRGGMGEVYRAEQLEPVRRSVALKRLHLRKVEARHLAYFEVERQLLAQMKHPAIAQVFDAGTTPEGHPFFAMELIEGRPLTAFCEERGLPLRERLELFIRVCEGVQHAHQKGVVHRDLKPGNILVAEVDGRALPKIIDFGIATAASRARGPEAAHERAGTPDYMSPEQAGLEAVEVDTRSDVYSLGVLLHELLAGHRPSAGGTSEAAHTASATQRPPSAQIDTLAPGLATARARQLHVGRQRLRRLLRNELDWVVLKAMRRDRNERYPSAAALAEELRRFLDGRPLAAVPATRRYVWGKFVSRHRLGFAAGGAVAAAVLAGLALSLYGLQQAREQRALAETRSAELERVVAFQQAMLEGVDIEGMGIGLAEALRRQVDQADPALRPALESVLARTSTPDIARGLVDRHVLAGALRALEADFGDQPALAADLRESVAQVQEALGLPAGAVAVYRQVEAFRAGAQGESDPRTLRTRVRLAGALMAAGDVAGAEPLIAGLVAALPGLPPTGDLALDIGVREADLVAARGDRPRARDLLAALHGRALAARGERDPKVMALLNQLAITTARAGDVPAGRALAEALFPVRREVLGSDHEDVLATMTNLAVMRAMSGDFEQAIELQQGLVDIQSRRLGAEHPITLDQRGNLGNMLLDLGRVEEAEAVMRGVLAARERVLGPDAAGTLRARLNLAALLARSERAAEALPLEQAVIDGRTRLLGPEHPDTLFIRINHAGTLHRAGRSAEGLAGLEAVLPAARRVLGPTHPQLQLGLGILMNLREDTGDLAGSIAAAEELLAIRLDHLGAGHPEVATTAWSLARRLQDAGQGERARALREEHVAPLLAADPESLPPPARRARQRILDADAGGDAP